VVDVKVISRELVWRKAERDRAEGGTAILLRISTEVYVGCQLLQALRGYLRISYDYFMFIEN
jgi:hypothetical protein